MERKTTLKELAKILNVSISTVSKALNDSSEINPDTKARIKEVALANKYVPNELAQSLKGKKTKTLGVIIPEVLSHFFAKSLHGIETMASSLGYKIIICISNESVQKESESLNILVNTNVDGIIMSLARETQATDSYDHFKRVFDYGIPIVLFDRVSDTLVCDKITVNDKEITHKATRELHRSGCKNIIYLSTIYDTSVDKQRQIGYTSAMKELQSKPEILHIKDYSYFEENLLKIIKKFNVDGIVAADELSAVSAMKTALNHGYKIPEDISVIGFTNGVLGENFIPSLTTVEQYAEEQGSSAVELIIGRIQKTIAAEPVHKIIKTAILHRNSTRESLSLQK